MTSPFEPVRRSISEEWLAEDRAEIKRERAGMSAEDLMQLEKQIEETRNRGNTGERVGERLRSLQRTHYRETGAGG